LVRFYFLVKIPVGKISINFACDKGFLILLLLSDHAIHDRANFLNGNWCTRCRTMLPDWMHNRDFFVD